MYPTKFSLFFLDGGQDTGKYLFDRSIPMLGFKPAEMDLDWANDSAKVALLRQAKAAGALIIGKRYEQNANIDAPDMIAEARRYYDGIGSGTSSFTVMAQQYPEVDIWEGPNEVVIKTADNGVQRMQKYAQLLAEIARLMQTEAHKRAGLGGWSVGNPEMDLWKYWAPVLKACKDYNAVLTRHCYGPTWNDPYTSLRYRLDEAEYQKLGYVNTPVIITECGFDPLSSSGPQGWKEAFDYEHNGIYGYWNAYLKPYFDELGKDPYVLYGTLYTDGTGGSHDNDRFDVAHMDIPNSPRDFADAILENPTAKISTSVPVPVPPTPIPPAPTGYTHKIVGCLALNVRQFPWTGNVTPPIVITLRGGALVHVYATVKFGSMANGWCLIASDGNQWVNAYYLAAL